MLDSAYHHFKKMYQILAYPLYKELYCLMESKCPAAILHGIGIADPKYRPDFETLARLFEEVASRTRALTVAECGVYRGSSVLGMAHLARSLKVKAKIYAFDSFEGFPEPHPEDKLENDKYHDSCVRGGLSNTSYKALQRRVDALGFSKEIKLVKGFFENTLQDYMDLRFDLVHLDCDLYQSYVTCLDFFYDRVKSGGYIVFDDYQSVQVYPGAKKAIDAFFADRPEKVQVLSSRQRRYFVQKI